jgi:hypothetical protein
MFLAKTSPVKKKIERFFVAKCVFGRNLNSYTNGNSGKYSVSRSVFPAASGNQGKQRGRGVSRID